MTSLASSMGADAFRWTFFIAHAGADTEAAEELYGLLAPHAPTFLDTKCIQLGDDWDLELMRAQQQALISVVLVSARTERAYYQREEIAAAIELSRAKGKAHRVVPIFLDPEAESLMDVPFGLRLKHGLRLTDDFGLDDAAKALHDLLRNIDNPQRAGAEAETKPAARLRRSINRLLRSSRAGWLAGTVAVGVLVAFGAPRVIDRFFSPPGNRPLPAPKAGVPEAESSRTCVAVDYLSPSVIPHYLLNSIGSENFPYWLRIVATNKCNEDRIMSLRFERGDGIQLTDPPQVINFTVRKGSTETRTEKPRFDLTNDQPESITFHWKIEDERQTEILKNSSRIEIVVPLTIAWDLQKPVAPRERVPVEREFLLGSLKAWILNPPPPVVSRARECRTTPTSRAMLEREDAIRACYRYLFTGDSSVLVSRSAIEFPAGDRQRIRSPINLIEDRTKDATSLEAALLFTAVMEAARKVGIDNDLVMIVAPVDESIAPSRKTAFIAWSEDRQAWHAVDLRMANTKTFDENMNSASTRVAAIIRDNAELARAMNTTGVFFSPDTKIAMINFARVPTEYRIRGLP